MIGLAAPGAKVASGPGTPSIAQEHGVAGGAGEQSGATTHVDDDTGGVEHDPTNMATKHGSEHVARIQLVAGRRFTTPIIDCRRNQRLGMATGQFGEMMLQRGLVDDDVGQRLERTDRPGLGGGCEDRQQRVEASLPVVALQE